QRDGAARNPEEPEPQTLAVLRAERAGTREAFDLLAEVDGRDVGSGSVAWGPMSLESRNVFLFAWGPAHRRHRGGAGALLERLVAFAREHGMERMTTLAYADEPESI